jgi:hypothetical protein
MALLGTKYKSFDKRIFHDHSNKVIQDVTQL